MKIKFTLFLVAVLFSCDFESRMSEMKRPIIVVAKSCNPSDMYTAGRYCRVILRDSVGKMIVLGVEHSVPIAESYSVGDTLK